MDLGLQDKIILVTGGATGIGEGISRVLAAEGAVPVIIGQREADNKQTVASIKAAGGNADSFKAELTLPEQCNAAIAFVVEKYGRIDSLVNNAGVNDGIGLANSNYDDFMHLLHGNVVPYFLMAHHALPYFIRSKGSIVNISSKIAEISQDNTSAYPGANSGPNALTREWAVELLPYAIRVNAIIVAKTATPLDERSIKTFPHAEEVANIVAFLLSSKSSHTTGQLVRVNGGYVHLNRVVTF